MFTFIRKWILIFAMLMGIGGYFAYDAITALDSTHAAALEFVTMAQPILLFAMLFLTFCKVDTSELRLCPWHGKLAVFQAAIFIALGFIIISIPQGGVSIAIEGAMLCFICPVATAAVVITRKLGGSPAHIASYTILINIVAALLIPIVMPFVHPSTSMSIFDSSMVILSKVMPLLLLPMILAFIVRRVAPGLASWLSSKQDLAFYMWVVALTMATASTTRILVKSNIEPYIAIVLILVSLVCCISQFAIGWKIGEKYGERITAGQALGQKNTILAIWMGYTFFSPITAIAGGFYLIFHNLINSYQLAHVHKNACQNSNS